MAGPSLQYFSEWWKQLAGEPKGDQKGIFHLELQLTSQQTCTHWVNLSKKNPVSCLKQLSVVDKPRKNVIIPTLEEDLMDLVTSKEKTLTSLPKSDWRCSSPTLTVTYRTWPSHKMPSLLIHYLLLRILSPFQVTWTRSTHLTSNQVLLHKMQHVCPSWKKKKSLRIWRTWSELNARL